MIMNCKRCGSQAINHHIHGRDGSGPNLCDVCFWRDQAEQFEDAGRPMYGAICARLRKAHIADPNHEVKAIELWEKIMETQP
jgi:hypothetical protein